MDTNFRQIREAMTITEIICLATLIANDLLDEHATVSEANAHFNNLENRDRDCYYCPVVRCLACSMNE
jgi:hypothetical protein